MEPAPISVIQYLVTSKEDAITAITSAQIFSCVTVVRKNRIPPAMSSDSTVKRLIMQSNRRFNQHSGKI
jgi:hypothetical protein